MNTKDILKNHSLKFTANRELILELFSNNKHALSYNNLESLLNKKLDRVTVYRTLKSFEESGIIHQIHDGSSQIKYALCHGGTCSNHNHSDAHAHFRCEDCDKTFCLEEVKVPEIKLPTGYKKASQSVFIQGVCDSCNA